MVETSVIWTMGRVLRVCDLGVWRVRVVSTMLEYTMSLGQVLPWGATWAPLEWIPVVGKMVYEVDLGVNL